MAKEKQSIEHIIQQASEGFLEAPSADVLRGLRFRLWKEDFFSLRPKKFNVVYAGILAAGLVSALVFTGEGNKAPDTAESSIAKDTQAAKPESEAPQFREDEPAATQNQSTVEKPAPPPLAAFDADITVGCAPLEVHFENHSRHSSEAYWDFGNGKTSGEINPEVVYTTPGTYQVSLLVTNEAGMSHSLKRTIVVHEKPEADFSIDIQDSKVTTREVHFENHSRGANEFIWDFGDRQSGKNRNVSHTYPEYNVYQVKLIAISENRCRDTATLTNRFIEKNFALSFPRSFRPNPSSSSHNGFYQQGGLESGIYHPEHNGVLEYRFEIYTPNGIKIFETDNIQQGWNGFVRGRMAPPGTYRFRATGVYPNNQAFRIEDTFRVVMEDYYMN